jgi:hypothetical protein
MRWTKQYTPGDQSTKSLRALLPGCGAERVQLLPRGPQLFAIVFGEGLAGQCAALQRIVREACGGEEGTMRMVVSPLGQAQDPVAGGHGELRVRHDSVPHIPHQHAYAHDHFMQAAAPVGNPAHKLCSVNLAGWMEGPQEGDEAVTASIGTTIGISIWPRAHSTQ